MTPGIVFIISFITFFSQSAVLQCGRFILFYVFFFKGAEKITCATYGSCLKYINSVEAYLSYVCICIIKVQGVSCLLRCSFVCSMSILVLTDYRGRT